MKNGFFISWKGGASLDKCSLYDILINSEYKNPHCGEERRSKMLQLRKKHGFTLVEIMIVVAIISLLAAIAIPNLLRARHNANEAAGIAALRTLSTSCESFRSAQTPTTYPANLAALSTAVPAYIDAGLAGATAAGTAKQGYFFTYALVNANQFTCLATPAVAGTTGTRVFFVDESGVIRLNNATGAPIE
jgi:prepilin-type N-terminal cleavage/methylation domain-containing protein